MTAGRAIPEHGDPSLLTHHPVNTLHIPVNTKLLPGLWPVMRRVVLVKTHSCKVTGQPVWAFRTSTSTGVGLGKRDLVQLGSTEQW